MSSDIASDVEAIKKGMKNWKRNNSALIKVLGSLPSERRQKIKMVYKSNYGTDLISDMKSETGKKFNEAIDALFCNPIEYDCMVINRAVQENKNKVNIILEILSNRTNLQIDEIQDKYLSMYDRALLTDAYNDIGGDEGYIAAKYLNAKRSEVIKPNDYRMETKAKELHELCEGKVSWHEPPFNDFLTDNSGAEITQISRHYYKLYGKTVTQTIRELHSGEHGEMYIKLLCSAINPPEFFAGQIKEALKNKDTCEAELLRIIVSRQGIDLPLIKKFYKKLFTTDLTQDIENNTSGSTQSLLVEICNQ